MHLGVGATDGRKAGPIGGKLHIRHGEQQVVQHWHKASAVCWNVLFALGLLLAGREATEQDAQALPGVIDPRRVISEAELVAQTSIIGLRIVDGARLQDQWELVKEVDPYFACLSGEGEK